MNLEAVYRKRRDLVRHGEHLLPRLRRQSEYDMGAKLEPPPLRHFEGAEDRAVIVPPVHELERLVVDGLDTVFERHVAFLSEPLEYFYLLLVHAVRPRAYGDADDAVIRERLPVHIFKLTGVAICVGVRLEDRKS